MNPVTGRFAELVTSLPSAALAVDEGDSSWTFGDLDRRSRELAVALARLPGEAPLGLVARPSAQALAAMLGAMRAGRIIAPVAASAEMLARLGADAVLTDDEGLEIPDWQGTLAPLAGLGAGVDDAAAWADRAGEPDGAAIVCFSSGSSGTPRGIMLTQASIAAGALGYREALELRPSDRLLWQAKLEHGASLTVAFGALLAGACLVPFDPDRGLSALVDEMERSAITVLHVVPSLMRRIAGAIREPARLERLRLVKIGGEPAFGSDVETFCKTFPPGVRLVNGLGITEASGNVCFAEVGRSGHVGAAGLPVGRPARDTEIRLIDEQGQSVAPGEVGRIVVSSPMLAAGYWKNPERTAAAFVSLPGREGRHLWTQDVGRLTGDGLFEHLGRMDDVVKVRGRAVATGQVEATLRGLPGVDDAAVVPVRRGPGGDVELTAFVVASLDVERAALSGLLEGPMLPARIVRCDALPRLESGKVDRQALRALSQEARPAAAGGSGEEGILTAQLCSTFEWTLGAVQVDPDADFFDLGGDSLAALELLDHIERHLGVELPMSTLLDHGSPAGLSRLIADRGWPQAAAPVKLLRPGRPGERPIFLMPGRAVELVAMRGVARGLSPLPVHGLQQGYMRDDVLRRQTLTEMAAGFLPHVEAVQPTGPYRLVGASFGGRVMFELARLLRARGEEVELLALLDTYGPGYLRRWPKVGPRGLLRELRAALKRKRKTHFARVGREVRLQMRWLRMALGPPRVRRRRDRYAYRLALAEHATRATPQPPVDVRIDLFRCEQQPSAELARPWRELGWRGLGLRGVVVHDIPGRHGSYLEPDVMAQVAREIFEVLGVEP